MGTIRRYSSRKLYDPAASRYVSLEEVAQRIRGGEEIEVRESTSGEDVTAHTLMQLLLDESKSGRGLPPQLLHDLVRASGQRGSGGAAQARGVTSRLIRAALERVASIPEARREAAKVEERLRQLDSTLAGIEKRPAARPRPTRAAPAAARRRPAARRR
jgi:polyhydroxyalkanoate synthesis repressor PhaR